MQDLGILFLQSHAQSLRLFCGSSHFAVAGEKERIISSRDFRASALCRKVQTQEHGAKRLRGS